MFKCRTLERFVLSVCGGHFSGRSRFWYTVWLPACVLFLKWHTLFMDLLEISKSSSMSKSEIINSALPEIDPTEKLWMFHKERVCTIDWLWGSDWKKKHLMNIQSGDIVISLRYYTEVNSVCIDVLNIPIKSINAQLKCCMR